MRRWEEALARRLPPFARRMFVAPCPCCGEPARWKRPHLPASLRLLMLPLRLLTLPLRLFAFPLRVLFRIDTLAALALIGALSVYGTPHIAWDYRCHHSRAYNPRCQSFDYCAYYGLYGRRVVYPGRGESCWLVRLMPAPTH